MKRKIKIILFNSLVFKILFNYQIVCIGDSHMDVFKFIRNTNFGAKWRIDISNVGGATAQGIVNPNSKTDALNKFRKRLKYGKRHQKVVIQLGEVDCGFVIWYYAEKFNLTVEDQMNRSLVNYKKFLEELKTYKFKEIIVMSPVLPTIKDNQKWGGLAKKRSEIKASQRARTNLTILYSIRLEKICEQLNITFHDYTEELLDKNSQTIKDVFINKNPLDHHLDAREYSKLILTKMNI